VISLVPAPYLFRLIEYKFFPYGTAGIENVSDCLFINSKSIVIACAGKLLFLLSSSMARIIINTFFLLIIAVTSLPIKKASQVFCKKQASEQLCDDCSDDAPVKKADDSLDFKDFPCCYHQQHQVAAAPIPALLPAQLHHAYWRLPLWPAVDIHTPPPNAGLLV
jgi:hypothetical protein